MSDFDRFVLHPMQEYTDTQTGSPVRICCSRQCTETHSGVNFVQVRMQNLSEQFIFNVILTIEAFADDGEKLYEQRKIVLSNCCAEAGALFGEERMIALVGQVAASLTFTVECVVFDDGLLWRKNTIYRRKKPEVTAPSDDKIIEPETDVCEAAEEVSESVQSEAAEVLTADETNEEVPEPEEPVAPEESLDKAVEKLFEAEKGGYEPKRPDPAEVASEIFRRIFEQREDVNESEEDIPVIEDAQAQEADPAAVSEPVEQENTPACEPAAKKKSYALLIWLLIILGVGLAAYALYLLYINGNIPWIS